jgi:hypothetical protein
MEILAAPGLGSAHPRDATDLEKSLTNLFDLDL